MNALAELLLVGVLVANVFLIDRSRRQADRFGVGALLGAHRGLADSIQRINYASAALALVAVGLLVFVLGSWHGRELLLETQRDTAQYRLAVAVSRGHASGEASPGAAAGRAPAPASAPAAAAGGRGSVQLIIATALSDS